MRTRIAKIDGSLDILTPRSAPKSSVDSTKRQRQGWEDAFRRMAASGDDELLDGNLLNHDYDDNDE